MATFTVTIDTQNDAFDLDPSGEVARILVGLAGEVQRNWLEAFGDRPLFDVNGNEVGRVTYEGGDEE